MTTIPATQRQKDFLDTLRKERVITPQEDAALAAILPVIDKRVASDWITRLLNKPKGTMVLNPGNGLAEAFERVVVGLYAVPSQQIQIPGLNLPKDLTFLEVRNNKGRKYLNQLHGGWPAAYRTRFTLSQQIALLGVIAGKHVEYGRAFGQHFGRCGRCGADLTDAKSRATQFGPECRKIYGIA